jgi:deoxyhypusine monooxygenase
LEDEKEEEMVRHEAAESLGSIGSKECIDVLEKYANCELDVIRESVQVGLGMGGH